MRWSARYRSHYTCQSEQCKPEFTGPGIVLQNP